MTNGIADSSRDNGSMLSRVASRFRTAFASWPDRNHRKRYVLGGIISIVGIWLLCGSYMLFLPKTYISRWTFILPGAGAGVSVTLDTIGQTSSVSASPFSSTSLNPKVIYKEIVSNEPVLTNAAQSMNLKPEEFGKPRIKLVDETTLMICETKGSTPQLAQDKAIAVINAFQQQLDTLRQDEIDRRASSIRETIKGYQENLKAARQRIFEMQQKSGLVSIDQFNQVTTSLEELRRKLILARTEADSLESSQAALAAELGIDSSLASLALSLSANTVFAKSLADYADLTAQASEQSRIFGSRNPLLLLSRAKQSAALEILKKIAKKSHVSESELPALMIALVASKGREQLLKELVAGEARAEGKRREVQALDHEFKQLDGRLNDLTSKAARLEDLKKDHLVAEAVFSSALARVDTNKADLFASYPIVQVLSPPDLPERPAQPRLIFAILGGTLGTLLAVAAWVIAWLRQLFVLKHKKKN